MVKQYLMKEKKRRKTKHYSSWSLTLFTSLFVCFSSICLSLSLETIHAARFVDYA